MVNNKRKYFYRLIYFSKFFSKRNECTFKIKFIHLLFIKFDFKMIEYLIFVASK